MTPVRNMSDEEKRSLVPKNTIHCHGRLVRNEETGNLDSPELCPWWWNLGVLVVHRDVEKAREIAERLKDEGKKVYGFERCDNAEICEKKCWSSAATNCLYNPTRCELLDFDDPREDTLLWDQCKICGIGEEGVPE